MVKNRLDIGGFNIMAVLFSVLIFLALVVTASNTLTQSTTDTESTESFAIPDTITSFVTLTGNDPQSIVSLTNSTTEPIQTLSAGNYTFYSENATVMILDNSSYTGNVVVNYLDRPASYMDGVSSTLAFMVILMLALVYFNAIVNQAKGGRK